MAQFLPLFIVIGVIAPTRASYNVIGAIVYLMEWKYEDIATECPFLKKYGFGAAVISPPTENVVDSPYRPWQERYEVVSYKLETRSGDEAALREMIKTCAMYSIRILADLVLNNMANSTRDNAVGTGGSTVYPKSYSYEDFRNSHFNDFCEVKDFQDANNVRNCEVSHLSDLKQSDAVVRDKQVKLMNKLMDMGVAGFMVDRAKYMWPWDLTIHQTRVTGVRTNVERSRPIMLYNVENPGTNEAVHWDEYNLLGKVTDYSYGKEIGKYFKTKSNVLDITKQETIFQGLIPSEDALVFLTNVYSYCTKQKELIKYHEDPELYKLATAFMLSYPHGKPLILSSYKMVPPYERAGPPANAVEEVLSPGPDCNGGWNCEHRLPEVYRMVYFYRQVKDQVVAHRFTGTSGQFAFTRGDRGFIAFNLGDTYWTQSFQTSLPDGEYCEIVTGGLGADPSICADTATKVIVHDKGSFELEVPPKSFRAIHTWNKTGLLNVPDMMSKILQTLTVVKKRTMRRLPDPITPEAGRPGDPHVVKLFMTLTVRRGGAQ